MVCCEPRKSRNDQRTSHAARRASSVSRTDLNKKRYIKYTDGTLAPRHRSTGLGSRLHSNPLEVLGNPTAHDHAKFATARHHSNTNPGSYSISARPAEGAAPFGCQRRRPPFPIPPLCVRRRQGADTPAELRHRYHVIPRPSLVPHSSFTRPCTEEVSMSARALPRGNHARLSPSPSGQATQR